VARASIFGSQQLQKIAQFATCRQIRKSTYASMVGTIATCCSVRPTRGPTTNLYVPPSVIYCTQPTTGRWLSTYGRSWAFAVAGPSAWNSLPDPVCNLNATEAAFRRLLKTFLFAPSALGKGWVYRWRTITYWNRHWQPCRNASTYSDV